MTATSKSIFLFGLLVSFCFCGRAQNLDLRGTKDGLSLHFAGKERLNGGKMLTHNSTSNLSINKKIENDVALSALTGTSILVVDKLFAGAAGQK